MQTEVQDRAMVAIRGMDARLWQDVRIEALRRHVPIRQIVEEALRDWLEKQQQGTDKS